MFNKEASVARKRYKIFVENGMGKEEKSPMTKVYGGVILGSEGFIREILKNIEESQLEKEAVSHRKALRAPLGVEGVLSAVCRHYGITKQEINNSEHSEARKMSMYLMKKQTVATTRDIGELLGNMSYAAAAKMYQRIIKELAEDKGLRKKMEKIRKEMSYVEG